MTSKDAPLYQQVKHSIAAKISSGEHAVGSSLPPMDVLCRMYAVSSITVRRALAELESDGLIRKGRGTTTTVVASRRRIRFALIFQGFDDAHWASEGAVFGELLAGVGNAAWQGQADFAVIRIGPDDDPSSSIAAAAEGYDGILLRWAGDLEPETVSVLENRSIPFVAIKRKLSEHNMSYATVDDYDTAHRATHHLIEHGHKEIALVTGPPNVEPRREQIAGYRAALADAGIEARDSLLRLTPSLRKRQDGVDAVAGMLSSPPQPTAVVSYGGEVTVGVVSAIHRAGLSIPDDIALVACGDGLKSHTFTPSLTTLATSHDEIGQTAVEALFDIVHSPENSCIQKQLRPPMVLSESCGHVEESEPIGATAVK